ncbi:amino acid adenylation domain-containing protein [Pantoea cypripedii]|uniref:amino acid adenylation domain-containing protein n=1 Tax=Pantoea cypripedii TaxID=55209 RepID=UPI000A105FB7|nr:amino acid adenylation domain-containing protein [Pantoea cypripedii]MBP2195107.1 amino acid adenylation domain-containing protein [Pantoea cypripedii]
MPTNKTTDKPYHGLSVCFDTFVEYPRDSSLAGLFEQKCRSVPQHIALIDHEEGSLTFAEIERRSGNLAKTLCNKGVRPGDIVAVNLPRSTAFFIAILAIIRAGAAYLPLDPEATDERAAYIIADANPLLKIVAPDWQGDTHNTLCYDVSPQEDCQLPEVVRWDALAYLMYTSGSTGRPKGVRVTHRNVVRLAINAGITDFSPSTRMLQTASVIFDASAFEWWGCLLNGGTIIIVPQETLTDPVRLKAALVQYAVNTLFLTTPLFNLLAGHAPQTFSTLKTLIFGGDIVVPDRVADVMKHCPGLVIKNGYGPTENGSYSTVHTITLADTQGRIPIGRPISNSTAYILDEEKQPLPWGEQGELYVGGDGVALGYLGKDELSAKVFTADPFIPGGGMYKTGDIASMRPDGTVEFFGRRDNQVKIRGYRIELDEIEWCLRNHPQVKDTVVKFFTRNHDDKYLVAWVEAEPALDEFTLRDYLKANLPAYMMPGFLIFIEAFPVASNGKIDRAILPDPLQQPDLYTEHVEPVTEREKAITGLWRTIIGYQNLGIHDSLFQLGVDSLVAVNLASSVNAQQGCQLSVTDLLANPTVAKIVALIESTDNKAAVSIREPHTSVFSDGEAWPLTWQQLAVYQAGLKAGSASTQYNIPLLLALPPSIDISRFEQAWWSVVERHQVFHFVMPLSEALHQKIKKIPPTALPRYRTFQRNELIKPFALESGPLWRAALCYSDQQWHFFLDIHHLLIDGQSVAILLQELDQYYAGQTLPPARQYSDYIDWTQSVQARQQQQEYRRYWQEQRPDGLRALALPYDSVRDAELPLSSDVVPFRLETERYLQLKQLAQRTECTLFELLSTLYGVFLSTVTASQEVHFVVPSGIRPRPEFEQVVGMFVNSVVMSVTIPPASAFDTLIRTTRESLRNGLAHGDISPAQQLNATDRYDEERFNLAMATMFAFHSQAMLHYSLAGSQGTINAIHPGQAMFDLNLQLSEWPTDISAEWEFNASLFKRETVEYLRDVFIGIIDNVLRHPDMPVTALPVSERSATPEMRVMQDIEFDL